MPTKSEGRREQARIDFPGCGTWRLQVGERYIAVADPLPESQSLFRDLVEAYNAYFCDVYEETEIVAKIRRGYEAELEASARRAAKAVIEALVPSAKASGSTAILENLTASVILNAFKSDREP